MRTAGIVGGIGPESTIEYYRQIVATYRAKRPDGSYPPVLINSIDMTKMLTMIGAGELAAVTEFLLAEIRTLARAGADFGVLASNTPHIVFGALKRAAPIPLLSIVDAACDAARAAGLRRPGLFGTRFTMGAPFYPDAFAAAGMTVVVPSAPEQTYIHDHYLGELVHGVLRPETRAGLLAIIESMQAREGIDGLILGGTELPLLLSAPAHGGLPLLDTTRLHVARIVERMLAD